ncbi:MAG: lysophospholipid acyltransferase family protein [Candidatus Omnitrophota bacterium]
MDELQAEAGRKIHVKRRGNAFGIGFFEITFRIFGLRGAYSFLYFVCLHYLLFDQKAVQAALAYVEKRFRGENKIRQYLHVYRLFLNQGRHLIDRYVVARKPELFDIQVRGYEQFKSLVQNASHGIILLTAHVGNWQVGLTALRCLGKKVYLVMRPEDNRAVRDTLKVGDADDHLEIISPEQYLGGVLEIMKALEEGHGVSIMGDRSYTFDTVGVPFLGAEAYFPYGAFSIAAAAGCPVVVLLTQKESDRKYVVDMSNVLYPSYAKGEDKKSQLQRWAGAYASMLETFVNKFPYQCFMFHNVWSKQKETVDDDQ